MENKTIKTTSNEPVEGLQLFTSVKKLYGFQKKLQRIIAMNISAINGAITLKKRMVNAISTMKKVITFRFRFFPFMFHLFGLIQKVIF